MPVANIFPSDSSDQILDNNWPGLGRKMANNTLTFLGHGVPLHRFLRPNSSLAPPWLTVSNPDKQDKEGFNILGLTCWIIRLQKYYEFNNLRRLAFVRLSGYKHTLTREHWTLLLFTIVNSQHVHCLLFRSAEVESFAARHTADKKTIQDLESKFRSAQVSIF